MPKQRLDDYYLKAFSLLGVFALLGFWLVASLQKEYLLETEDQFGTLYGSRLSDFYTLGDEFQVRWLTEKEDLGTPCVVYEYCVIIKIATVADCEIGATLKYAVLDVESKVLSNEESEVFLVKSGEIIQIELGSRLLTDSGSIEALDANCSASEPSV